MLAAPLTGGAPNQPQIRFDHDAPVIAAALCAAARGDEGALRALVGKHSMLAVPVDLHAAVQIAASAGHTGVIHFALRCLSAQSSATSFSRVSAAPTSEVSQADAAVAAALPIACAVGPRAELLLQHLLDEWQAVPTRSTFWLAAEQRSVSMLDRLLQCPAWKDPSRVDKAIVRLDSSSGDLELLERLLAASPLLHPSPLEAESAKADSDAIAQRLLLDARDDPAAAGIEAIEAAASHGRVAVLEALLADPRVDASGFATERLLREPALPAASVTLLARQSSVLRALAMPRGDAAPLRPHFLALAAVDAAALAAAAWRRRRAAVTGWWSAHN